MKYRAFISYNRADTAIARWLLYRLETYRVPRRLVGMAGRNGPVPARLGAFFRDREELAAAGDLGQVIRDALAESEALIVICSPAAARSRWVNAEIEAFRGLGRRDRIYGFVVSGLPGTPDTETNCFPLAFLARDPHGTILEPMAADARREGDGRERAFTKLVAGIIGVPYDLLARREAQRHIRRVTTVAIASMTGMMIALGLAVAAYVARNDAARRQAQTEDLLGFLIGDLRGKLTTVGRLDLMRTVDEKATSYYAKLVARDLSDRALEDQARLLTGIGQERVEEGRRVAALQAFHEAHDRSLALYERDRGNGRRLFDLAQAQFWIGEVAFREGRYDDAELWLGRYRDSAIKLAAMDPTNITWQQEVVYGEQNLATLDQQLGRYAAAERGIRATLGLYRKWLAERPNDLTLRRESANAASWLGTLALAQGHLLDARGFANEAFETIQQNVAAEPANRQWEADLASWSLYLAEVDWAMGDLDALRDQLDTAETAARDLSAHDPTNNTWRARVGEVLWWRARLASMPAEALDRADKASQVFERAQQADPTDQAAAIRLSGSRTTAARSALALGNLESARAHLTQALAALEPFWNRNRSETLRLALADVWRVSGDTDAREGAADSARAAWLRARDLLEHPAEGDDPMPFGRLASLVLVLYRLGDIGAAAPYRQRLHTAGFASPDLVSAEAARARLSAQ